MPADILFLTGGWGQPDAKLHDQAQTVAAALPPCCPDLNPIEMAFARRKALLQHEPARSINGLAARIGSLLGRLHPAECANFCTAAGCQRPT
jgi:transposase